MFSCTFNYGEIKQVTLLVKKKCFFDICPWMSLLILEIIDFTPKKRAKIVALREHTHMTIRKMGEELNLTKSTVGKILEMREDCSDVTATNRRGLYGRKRKTTNDDRMIMRNSLKDPRKISKDLQRDLAMAGIDLDSSIVRKRLVQAGRIARRPRKKQLLTDVMKKKRLVWAKNIPAILRCMVTDHSCLRETKCW